MWGGTAKFELWCTYQLSTDVSGTSLAHYFGSGQQIRKLECRHAKQHGLTCRTFSLGQMRSKNPTRARWSLWATSRKSSSMALVYVSIAAMK